MTKELHKITIEVPDEFLELCRYDRVRPADVLQGFLADLCGFAGWRSDRYQAPVHLSSDRDRAFAYYDHACAWNARWIRENVPCLAGEVGSESNTISDKELKGPSEHPNTDSRLPHN
jgi:hypothetical protein